MATLLANRKALLLDMNGTFMFGGDRFGESEDFSERYRELGGTLDKESINSIVRAAYLDLEAKYPGERYQHRFPSVEDAIRAVVHEETDRAELDRMVATFAHHELGLIPKEYAAALHELRGRFLLAAVVDIWSPKAAWLDAFVNADILHLFSAAWFSSDHGIVKPSSRPFERVLDQLGVRKPEAIVIGDSPRRDLGGARNAGIDCILVGGAVDPRAVGCVTNLLKLCDGR